MAVEKSLWNIKFKNEEKYINGSTIAKFLQTMLNTAYGAAEFYVAYQKDTSNIPTARYGGVLSCEIEPFSLRGTLAQTVSLDYKCKVSSQDAVEHASVNKTLEAVIGPVDGSFSVQEGDNLINYSFWSNLRYAKPSTTGDVNDGVFPTTYNLKGYIHIVREGGAVLSNHIRSYIVLDYVRYEVALRRGSHGVSFAVSNPLKAGNLIAETEYLSAGFAKSLYILYKDDYICNALRNFAEGSFCEEEKNPFLNKETGKFEITILEEYPEDGKVREVETTYYIIQVTCERESGAYSSFALSLMKKAENSRYFSD